MDTEIFRIFHSIAGWSDLLDWLVIFLAEYLPYLLIISWLFFILRLENKRYKIFIFLFTVLALVLARGIITETIRFFYQRPRPFEFLNLQPLFLNRGPSFPSGHAAFLFALSWTLFFCNKKWGWWFLSLVLINGLARIIGGVHWPSDIILGALVGLISFWVIRLLLFKYQPH